MKFIYLMIFCFLAARLWAQEDSTKLISLEEIKLSAKAKTQGNQLVHFYRSNLGSTLEEMMARLPEMSFIRRGSYGMEPAIRGLNGGQINVLIDGMRIYGACTDKMDPATIYIEPANLNQVQLKTGADGALSGSNIGGTLNLKMAEPSAQQAPFSLAVLHGFQSAANAGNTTLTTGIRQGNLFALASATYRRAGDYRAGQGQKVPFSGYEKFNYSLSLKYRLSDRVRLGINGLGDDGRNIGYPALLMDVGYAAARIGALSLFVDHPIPAIKSTQVKWYYNSIRHFMDDTHRPNIAMHMDMPGVSHTSGMVVETNWNLPANQGLETTADLSSTFQKASMTMYPPGEIPMYMLTWPDHKKFQAGAGGVWRYTLDSLWALTSSARIDWIQYALISEIAKQEVSLLAEKGTRRDLLVSGASSLQRKLNKQLQAGVSLQYGERAPTGGELYGYYLFNRQDNHDYLGNPMLKKEQALLLEFSITHRTSKSGLRIATLINRIRNYIFGEPVLTLSTMTPGATGVKRYINLPSATIAGLEGSLLWSPLSKLQVVTTMKYNYGIMNHRDPMPMMAPLAILQSVKWNIGRFSVTGELDAAAAQKRVYKPYGEDPTTGYVLIHARFSYPVSFGKSLMLFQWGAENILDKTYHQHADWGNVPRPGRNIYIQVKFSL